MIADMVNIAMTGIGFCHAAGLLIFKRGIRASNTIRAGKRSEPLNEDRERTVADSTSGF